MSLVFRDYQVMVIFPGSGTTQTQMGLSSESLAPPYIEAATKVYRSGDKYAVSGEESDAIYPLVGGKIVDEGAFHYFLKQLYRTAAPKDVPPPALYLVVGLEWSRRQLERLTQYLFEQAGVPALSFCYEGVAGAFAFAAPDCIVVDIGLDKTEISAVVDYEVDFQASRSLPVGSSRINSTLSKLLPDLSADQVEDLKLSGIVEVLTRAEDAKFHALAEKELQTGTEEEEGVVDVAAIVTSGRTREILEQREREKSGAVAAEPTNKEMESNSFTDRDGNKHTVGRERFEGADSLISEIVEALGVVSGRLSPRAQNQAWEHLVLIGSGTLLPGLKTELITRLEARYLITRPVVVTDTSTGADTTQMVRHTPNDANAPTQGPRVIRLAKIADYFPEWKQQQHNAAFLGAEIGAKQSFTTGLEHTFTSRQEYNEMGPTATGETL